MLTKDLLRVRRRGNRIFPLFCDPSDAELLSKASLLIDTAEDSIGLSLGEFDESTEELGFQSDDILKGLKKLITDRIELQEDDGSSEEFRWQVFQKAEELRVEGSYQDLDDFEAVVARSVGVDIESIRDRLYSDLPENKLILGLEKYSDEGLLHRWNAALVQGLLLRSVQVRMKVFSKSLAEKRAFFRQLKFNRLLSTVDACGSLNTLQNGDEFEVHLSGPLSLFDQAQNYGLRIAQFFPYLLHYEKYQLEAEVKWFDGEYLLKLDQTCGIKSHYKQKESYIPPELNACLKSFNEKKPHLEASAGESFIHLGRESYCFPDLTVTFKDSGRKLHIELFHRWHITQLHQRLEALSKNPDPSYYFGVCKSIAGKLDAESELFKQRGFWFRDFPTVQALSQVCERFVS